MNKFTNNSYIDKDVESIEDVISLKQFPPKLRKLAKYMLQNEEIKTVSDACRELDFNIQSIFTMIHRTKQNGNDFRKFIDEQSKMMLQVGKFEVYKALQQGAVSQSSTAHNDRKTYLLLTGDLKESTNININSLTVAYVPAVVTDQDNNREKGVIDTQPFIPKGK